MNKKNNILFVDVIATDSNSGGGSSNSLKLLLEDYHENKDELSSTRVYFLTNNYNLNYYRLKIPKSVQKLNISFPKVLNLYGGEIFTLKNLLKLFFHAIPVTNIQFVKSIHKNKIDSIIFNERRAMLTFLPGAIYLKIFHKIQIVEYIRGDYGSGKLINTIIDDIPTKQIVLADYLKNKAGKKNKKRTYTLVNGIKPFNHTNRTDNKVKNEKKIFLNVGSITKYKGQIDIIAAIIELKELEFPINFKVYFAGVIHDCEYHDEIEKLVVKHKLQDQVEFLGHVNNMEEYYLKADFLISSSYHEGVSRVLLEASMYEKVILASDIPGNKFIVNHGYNGFLYSKGNKKELAKWLIKLCELDQVSRESIGCNARKNVIDNFDINGKFIEFMEILND